MLRDQAQAKEVKVYAYCVMPDHVHLLLGPSPTCDIVTFIGQFKNLAQRAAWRHGNAVDYILDNPVRAGLVAARGENPLLWFLRIRPVNAHAGDKPPLYEGG